MFLDIKKIFLIILGISLFGIVLFFFAFVAIFLIPIIITLYLFRKLIFKKIISNNINIYSPNTRANKNKVEFIEADYKKEKEEDI